MGSTFGRYCRVTTFGESHGPAVGAVIDGIPAGVAVDRQKIQRDLDRRKPGTSPFVSARREEDEVEILSGIGGGRTLGSPVALVVRNRDARSEDYRRHGDLFRPGHADFTYFKKYGLPPQAGGGRASGRETVGRVAAGAVARAFLETHSITVYAYTVQIGGVVAEQIDPDFAESDPLRCADPLLAGPMHELVREVQGEGDSIGGVVEVAAHGLPAGLGDPVFCKLDALLGGALLSIGGVKGVAFGGGFELGRLRGSEANDPITFEGFAGNRSGGVLGGISTGQPLMMRLAVKPTASIARPQRTIDIQGRERTIEIQGRHDPCLCPRIAPVAEAMTLLVLADLVLEARATSGAFQ
jgi:chorismate synthase